MTEETYQGSVANARYNHMAAPWNSPLSFGVQAFIEYNGLIMNDRFRADVIRVNDIVGLDGADVRDAREPKAGAHGEWVFDPFYGGRNIVLSGFIEAGSLAVCNHLKSLLEGAFSPLKESPLKFRWFDIYDGFEDPNTANEYSPVATSVSGNYTLVKGNRENIFIANGFLSSTGTKEPFVLIRTAEQRKFSDVKTTLQCTNYRDNSEGYLGTVPCYLDSENYLKLVYDLPKQRLVLRSVIAGVDTELEESSLAWAANDGQIFWLEASKEGDHITGELWEEEPSFAGKPSLNLSYSLTGQAADLFGNEVLGKAGIVFESEEKFPWKIDGFSVSSIYPGDVYFNARKTNISIKDAQTSLSKFKRPFQITLRASDFRAYTSTVSKKWIKRPTEGEESVSGFRNRKYPRAYPLKYSAFSGDVSALEQNNILTINNRGTSYVEPLLYLRGPATNIAISNLTNKTNIYWEGRLTASDYLIFDCSEETVINSEGRDEEESLLVETEWIRYEPGWNELLVLGGEFKNSTELISYHQHGYV